MADLYVPHEPTGCDLTECQRCDDYSDGFKAGRVTGRSEENERIRTALGEPPEVLDYPGGQIVFDG